MKKALSIDPATVDDPPAHEKGRESFGNAPPPGQEKCSAAKKRKQQPEGFSLRVQWSEV
jgi:hypothetical protein